MEITTDEYQALLEVCILQIHQARNTIAKQVNTAVMGVYWHIGSLLSEKQINEGYGSSIVNRLSSDLKSEFPDRGLSPRNLWDMKRFYERYKDANAKL